jgi:hypothetical protein
MDDDDRELCCVNIITGERISGCSRILGTLVSLSCSSKFSVVLDVLNVDKRF